MSEMKQTDLQAMRTLIRLVSAGARKEDISGLSVDWNTVLPLAAEHHVIPLVACALLYSPGLECTAQLREHLFYVMRAESSANLIRRQRIMHLLQEMKAAGIDAKVIKGYAVAGCYAHPECRGAVDTDILIDIKQEAQAIKFMEEHGFRVDSRAATSHHVVCQHRKYGMVELHVALYAELLREVWFQKLDVVEFTRENCIEICVPDGVVETLGHTDQLVFLVLHMIKHFILEGATLRMIMDVSLYYSMNKSDIDHERFWNLIKKLHYEGFVQSVFQIAVIYGGFAEHEFEGINSDDDGNTVSIIEDIFYGGYLGAKETSDRYRSGMEYNRQLYMKGKSQRQYESSMLLWKIRGASRSMFPSMGLLAKKYPHIARHRSMLPFLWIYHVLTFPLLRGYKLFDGRDVLKNESVLSPVTERRVKMFKKLGML